MNLKVEFMGGLDLAFGTSKLNLQLKHAQLNMQSLITELGKNFIKEKEQFFWIDGKLRPGILCLINDCDWEIQGKQKAQVNNKDNIVFISTLHGG